MVLEVIYVVLSSEHLSNINIPSDKCFKLRILLESNMMRLIKKMQLQDGEQECGDTCVKRVMQG